MLILFNPLIHCKNIVNDTAAFKHDYYLKETPAGYVKIPVRKVKNIPVNIPKQVVNPPVNIPAIKNPTPVMPALKTLNKPIQSLNGTLKMKSNKKNVTKFIKKKITKQNKKLRIPADKVDNENTRSLVNTKGIPRLTVESILASEIEDLEMNPPPAPYKTYVRKNAGEHDVFYREKKTSNLKTLVASSSLEMMTDESDKTSAILNDFGSISVKN
jgi:hypothetical protein